jgi:hypothetical protein
MPRSSNDFWTTSSFSLAGVVSGVVSAAPSSASEASSSEASSSSSSDSEDSEDSGSTTFVRFGFEDPAIAVAVSRGALRSPWFVCGLEILGRFAIFDGLDEMLVGFDFLKAPPAEGEPLFSFLFLKVSLAMASLSVC